MYRCQPSCPFVIFVFLSCLLLTMDTDGGELALSGELDKAVPMQQDTKPESSFSFWNTSSTQQATKKHQQQQPLFARPGGKKPAHAGIIGTPSKNSSSSNSNNTNLGLENGTGVDWKKTSPQNTWANTQNGTAGLGLDFHKSSSSSSKDARAPWGNSSITYNASSKGYYDQQGQRLQAPFFLLDAYPDEEDDIQQDKKNPVSKQDTNQGFRLRRMPSLLDQEMWALQRWKGYDAWKPSEQELAELRKEVQQEKKQDHSSQNAAGVVPMTDGKTQSTNVEAKSENGMFSSRPPPQEVTLQNLLTDPDEYDPDYPVSLCTVCGIKLAPPRLYLTLTYGDDETNCGEMTFCTKRCLERALPKMREIIG